MAPYLRQRGSQLHRRGRLRSRCEVIPRDPVLALYAERGHGLPEE